MSFDLQPTLEDNLILLRPLVASDFDDLFSVASDPLIWEQHPNFDRYQLDVFKGFFSDAMQSGGALLVIDKASSKVIGSSRYNPPLGASNAIEIGWSFLGRDYWGGRYNRAMKDLMIEYAFRFVPHILFYVGGENIRSQKAVLKLGAKRVSPVDYPKYVKGAGENWIYLLEA